MILKKEHAFTHFFFEALDNSDTDSEAFSYAYTNANYYGLYEFDPPTNQQPQNSDNLYITWF